MSVVPHGLPHGWHGTTLREIAEIVGGVTKDAKKSLGQGFREVPYLRVANVQRGRLDLSEVKLISASESDIQKLSLLPGDMLLNEGGDRDKLGRGWIWQGQLPVCIHQNHVFRARLASPEIDPVYVAHFTNSMAQAYFAEQGSQTTNLASISLTKLGSLPIWLPPSREQTRIVAKLEELLSDLDAGVAELKAAQKKLAQYRQSLLKAAVEGALTAEWRARHEPAETGAQLLERILGERRTRWEAKQLARFNEQGRVPPKNWKTKYPEPVLPDTTDLPALPEGWVWASGEQLCEFITKGTTPPKDLDAGGTKTIPFLRVTNLTDRGELNLADEVLISPETHQGFLSRSVVYPNDVLMNIVGPPLGQVAVVPASFSEWNINQAIAIFRAVDGVEPWFVCRYLLSPVAQRWLKARAKTTAGQTNLTLEVCRSLPVPLPPQDEQQALLISLEAAMSAVVSQAQAIETSLKQSTAQRQNILRAAFTGQLVPQDPSDEPASALLARIRAERAAREAVSKPRGRKAKEAV